MKRNIIVVAVVMLVTPVWAVNKCTGPDGKVSYQEAACVSSNSMVVFDRSQSPPPTQNVMDPADAARALDAQMKGVVLDRMDRNAQERKKLLADAKPTPLPAPLDGVVSVGMRRDQVLKVWGNPARTNEVVRANGTTEQWVYPRGAAAIQYVHLMDGVVTSVNTAQLP